MGTAVTPPTRAHYLAAARLIERRGWCQGAFERLDGRVCAAGAINRAATSVAWLDFDYYQTVGSLIPFNDAPGRTKDEVLSALLGLAEVAPTEPEA